MFWIRIWKFSTVLLLLEPYTALTMSMTIAHFAIGVSFSVIVLYITGYRGHNLRTVPMFVFGVMAFMPDVHHIPTNTRLSDILMSFHSSPYANAFFMHQVMDTIDTGDSKMFAAMCIFTMFLFLSVLWASDIRKEYL